MIGTKIAELRKEKKLSQEQLAETLNTSRQAVSKWERGDAYPDIDRLKDLAICFNVSIDYLLDYDIESSSVRGFIEKLKNENKTRFFSISIDEVKSVIIKNKNNFDLLIASIMYLSNYWYTYRKDSVIDLLITYCKRALVIYKKDNILGISINNIKHIISVLYIIKKDYVSAKEYIKDAEFLGKDNIVADCEIKLGNYDNASKILSEAFINSIGVLINTNISQLRLYIRTNRIKEAYDLAVWSDSLIKSISKDVSSITDLLFVIVFIRACVEKYLKIDNIESIKFLKENNKNINCLNNEGIIELKYYSQKIDYYFLEKSIKEVLAIEIDECKGCLLYDSFKEVYEEVFKRN